MTSVRFVGSGDAFGSGGRLQTCILVEDGGWRGLLDCGASTLVGLSAAGVDPASLDAIAVSHLHGDHFGGLPFLLLDAQLIHRRATPLLVAGPADLEQRLRATMELLFPGSQRALEVVDVRFVVLDPAGPVALGPATLQAFDVEHACGSPPYALRLTTPSGRVVAYSGDTEWTDALLDASAGADLFAVETYFHDRAVRWHMSHADLVANLERITARRVVATHLSADMLDHVDDAVVPVAHDGLVVEL